MKSHHTLRAIGGCVLCLILTFSTLILTTAGEVKGQETQITLRVSGFGSVAYTIGTALETIALKRHPWMRLQAVESPGGGSDVVQLLTQETWSNSIITLSALWDVYATTGVGGVEPKQKFPDARDRVRDLTVMSRYNFMFVTLDPRIKNEKDLDGKRIGVGRIGQGVWGGLPTLALERAWPEIKAKIDYFSGPKGAVAALLDRKVDAAVMGASASPDLSVVRQTPAMADIVASGRDFYYIGFTKEGLERFIRLTSGVSIQEIPPGTLPGNQPRSLLVMAGVVPWAALATFPEDLAYEFTKFYIGICEELPKYHALAQVTASPRSLCVGLDTKSMHPGAVRAFREAGVISE
jgi:hypothetical protein